MSLAPCAVCRRHVDVRESTCPFCGARTAGLVAKQSWPARMSRAAIFTSTALALPACGSGKHEPEQVVVVAPAAVDAQVDQVAKVEPVDAAPTSTPNDAGARVPMDASAQMPDAAVAAGVKPTKGRAKIHGTLRDSKRARRARVSARALRRHDVPAVSESGPS